MWEKHDFETIFTSNYAMNIHDGIGKVFGSIERAYSMGANAYFGPRSTNRPHATSNYEPGNLSLKLTITDIHIVLHY